MHSFRKGRKDLDGTRDDKDEKTDKNLDIFDKSQSLMEWGGEGFLSLWHRAGTQQSSARAGCEAKITHHAPVRPPHKTYH